MSSVLTESEIFGISVFGDDVTIKVIPLINILAASPNNPFALLNIVDCTAYLAEKGLFCNYDYATYCSNGIDAL
jgi:hypothetical protein